MRDLSLIVPCYDEAPHLRESVETVLEVLDQSQLDYEVVFVDDCSRDATREILVSLCEGQERLRAIFHDRNRGRGAAFKTGFAASDGRVAGFIDIDLEVHPHYIPSLVAAIDHRGFDVATGYRVYRLGQTRALHRHLMSRVYRALCHVLLGFGVRDSETGYKFFKRETASDVVLGSESDGWFWDTEVMSRAALQNLRICEMPVAFVRRLDKKSTVRLFRDSWDSLVALHRFRARVGLSLLNTSPLYWTGAGYDLAMRCLYGRRYAESYARVAERIPDGVRVTDVCAGTGRLYLDFLRPRRCEYLGLDFNGHLLMAARRKGVPVLRFDVRTDEIPGADYVVMCSSLYHFRDRADQVLDRMLRAARKAVLVSEPVENLSSRPGWLGRLAAAVSNPGTGAVQERFDLESFRELAERHGAVEFHWQPGDRNAIAVFPPGEGGARGESRAPGASAQSAPAST